MSLPSEDSPDVSESSIPRAYLNSMSLKYLKDIQEEKALLGNGFPLTTMLIDEAIDKVHTSGRIPNKDNHCDISKPLPMKLTQRVYVPVKDFPTFNFVGKILGPKGNTLRRLEQKTQCKICIKGRNSMRDPAKEEEFRNSDMRKYAHLHRNLFIEISTVGFPIDCYSRLATALEEIRPYLIPDKTDKISKDQYNEMREVSESIPCLSSFKEQDTSSVTIERDIESPPPVPQHSPKTSMKTTSLKEEDTSDSIIKSECESPPLAHDEWTSDTSIKAEPMEIDEKVPTNITCPSLQQIYRTLRGPKLRRVMQTPEAISTYKRLYGSIIQQY